MLKIEIWDDFSDLKIAQKDIIFSQLINLNNTSHEKKGILLENCHFFSNEIAQTYIEFDLLLENDQQRQVS